MKVKICGITDKENLRAVLASEPDYIGLNFYHKSQRYCNFDSVSDLAFGKTLKVGVFVNSSADYIRQCVDIHQLDCIQLHGDEDLTFCSSIKSSFNMQKIIKVFRIADRLPDTEEWSDFADYFLFDSAGTKAAEIVYGGSGIKFNWKMLQSIDCSKEWFLAGGLAMQDILEIKKLATEVLDFFAVDINSKFEISPGVKDVNLVAKFIKELRK